MQTLLLWRLLVVIHHVLFHIPTIWLNFSIEVLIRFKAVHLEFKWIYFHFHFSQRNCFVVDKLQNRTPKLCWILLSLLKQRESSDHAWLSQEWEVNQNLQSSIVFVSYNTKNILFQDHTRESLVAVIQIALTILEFVTWKTTFALFLLSQMWKTHIYNVTCQKCRHSLNTTFATKFSQIRWQIMREILQSFSWPSDPLPVWVIVWIRCHLWTLQSEHVMCGMGYLWSVRPVSLAFLIPQIRQNIWLNPFVLLSIV